MTSSSKRRNSARFINLTRGFEKGLSNMFPMFIHDTRIERVAWTTNFVCFANIVRLVRVVLSPLVIILFIRTNSTIFCGFCYNV